MCANHSRQFENAPDPLYEITLDVNALVPVERGRARLTHCRLFVSNEFLAQLLADIPDVLPGPITTSAVPFASPYPPAPASGSVSVPVPTYPTSDPYVTCQWVSPDDAALVCGAPLTLDPIVACDHFRHAHDVRGNEKVQVYCRWRFCNVPPMLRGSLIRHVLTVHLGLLRWQCEVCGKVFSRKGTRHTCAVGG